MTPIPIVFAFDNNLSMPAAVCFYSLFVNANSDTVYDIHVLHSAKENIDTRYIDEVMAAFSRHKISYVPVDSTFDSAFEIRGITTPAYYRLLIPELLPQYNKVIYSDVDVIFRFDLSDFYFGTDLQDYYVAGVNSLSHLVPEYKAYFENMGLDAKHVIYSGNLLINSRKMKENGLIQRFKDLSCNRYKFQDMDILNIACDGKIKYVNPDFCLTTFISLWAVYDRDKLREFWNDKNISKALSEGIVHYNGQKPWRGYCPNFDIWWEYYRKSPIFDEKFYFDFFYDKLDELDRLPLIKRIKILARYFVYGRK